MRTGSALIVLLAAAVLPFQARADGKPSFFRFGGNLGLQDTTRGWSLRVVGENLTDKFTKVFKRDLALAAGSFYQAPEPPRLVFGEFRWSF